MDGKADRLSPKAINQPLSGQVIDVLARLWFIINVVASPFTIVYGCRSLNKCPIENKIPVYLLSQGLISLVFGIAVISTFLCCNDGYKATCRFKLCGSWLITLLCANIACHIVGAIWVLPKWEKFLREYSCESSAFFMAFGLLITNMLLYAAFLIEIIFYIFCKRYDN